MKYNNYVRNHVVFPIERDRLEIFINSEYQGQKHKLKYSVNSNSEDALTWSCFSVLRNLPKENLAEAIKKISEDAFSNSEKIIFDYEKFEIFIGKTYEAREINERTEVDAAFETTGQVVFIEAKLYSAMSQADPPEKPYNQLEKKIRVGLSYSQNQKKDFLFIILDIAPLDKIAIRKTKKEAQLNGSDYKNKWKTAWWFKYLKDGRNNSLKPLKRITEDINDNIETSDIANSFGWITWADIYKITMQGLVDATGFGV